VLEQAALVVRSAFRALAAGGTIGVERSAYEPPPMIVKPSKPRAPVHARQQGVVGFGGVGAIAGLDGLFGTSAVWTWLGARWPGFDVRLEATFGVPTDAVSSLATFHVARHTFAMDASVGFSIARGRFRIGGRAGDRTCERHARPTLRSRQRAA
jgi:hypothetical protein